MSGSALRNRRKAPVVPPAVRLLAKEERAAGPSSDSGKAPNGFLASWRTKSTTGDWLEDNQWGWVPLLILLGAGAWEERGPRCVVALHGRARRPADRRGCSAPLVATHAAAACPRALPRVQRLRDTTDWTSHPAWCLTRVRRAPAARDDDVQCGCMKRPRCTFAPLPPPCSPLRQVHELVLRRALLL